MRGFVHEVNKVVVFQLLSELKQAQNEWRYYGEVKRHEPHD